MSQTMKALPIYLFEFSSDRPTSLFFLGFRPRSLPTEFYHLNSLEKCGNGDLKNVNPNHSPEHQPHKNFQLFSNFNFMLTYRKYDSHFQQSGTIVCDLRNLRGAMMRNRLESRLMTS